MQQVKAVYLHVLSTNHTAINFYRKHSFQQHIYIPYYYNISGKTNVCQVSRLCFWCVSLVCLECVRWLPGVWIWCLRDVSLVLTDVCTVSVQYLNVYGVGIVSLNVWCLLGICRMYESGLIHECRCS